MNISFNLANIYLFNVNNRSTRKRCEICSKLTIKIPERRPSLWCLKKFYEDFEDLHKAF